MKPALLLLQLGTPEQPTARAVYRYLTAFLSDRRVVPLPPLLWKPLLYGLVAPLRARRVAEKYRTIWTEEGSPLRVYMERLTRRLSERGFQVAFAMRYGTPSIAEGLEALQGAREILFLPLYPQFSQTTTLSLFDELSRHLASRPALPSFRFVADYHDFPPYLEAVASRIEEIWKASAPPDLLLFSFHGLPESSRKREDPYFEQCHRSARLIAARLGLREGQWRVAFQSRFGWGKWFEPDCAELLARLPEEGILAVDVVCPGFAVDCLETLEEIALQGRERFLEAGGRQFRYLPALNDHPLQVAMIEALACPGPGRQSGLWCS